MTTSVTGQVFEEGDRILYLCQCGQASCTTGQRATVLSKEALKHHFDSPELDDDAFVFVKFDGGSLPTFNYGTQFIHLESLGVAPEKRGPQQISKRALRILLVDNVTKDQVPNVASEADVIINVEDAEISTVPAFTAEHVNNIVQVLGIKAAADYETQQRTMAEGVLAIGIAVANPDTVGGQG